MPVLQRSSGGLRRHADGVMARADDAPCCCDGPACPHCTGPVPSTYDVEFTGVTRCTLADRGPFAPPSDPSPDSPVLSWSGLTFNLSATGGTAGNPEVCFWFTTADGGLRDQRALVQFIDRGAGLTSQIFLDSRGPPNIPPYPGSAYFKTSTTHTFDGDCEDNISATNTCVLADCQGSCDGYGGSAVATPVLPP